MNHLVQKVLFRSSTFYLFHSATVITRLTIHSCNPKVKGSNPGTEGIFRALTSLGRARLSARPILPKHVVLITWHLKFQWLQTRGKYCIFKIAANRTFHQTGSWVELYWPMYSDPSSILVLASFQLDFEPIFTSIGHLNFSIRIFVFFLPVSNFRFSISIIFFRLLQIDHFSLEI